MAHWHNKQKLSFLWTFVLSLSLIDFISSSPDSLTFLHQCLFPPFTSQSCHKCFYWCIHSQCASMMHPDDISRYPSSPPNSIWIDMTQSYHAIKSSPRFPWYIEAGHLSHGKCRDISLRNAWSSSWIGIPPILFCSFFEAIRCCRF